MRIGRIISRVFFGIFIGFCLFFILLSVSEIHQANIDLEVMKTDYDCEPENPTYEEMNEFLVRDKTNLNKSTDGIFGIFFPYDCSNFTRDVKRNAINEGIRCAGVVIMFSKKIAHALVAFQTTDRGVIFIEPQLDAEVEIAVDIKYWGEVIIGCYIFWPKLKNESN